VDEEDFNSIPKEYLSEPTLGLVSGKDGLSLTQKILQKSYHYLNENGILIVEVGNSAAALEALYPNITFNWIEFQRGGDGVFCLDKKSLGSVLSY
jgi:ribosomal protein L3 glutamine methyltransferase